MECYKCSGTGFLPGFAHVAEGVCFACKGCGRVPDAKKKQIGYSRYYIEQFRGDSYFPADQSGMTRILAIGSIGHPTAEEWVIKDCTFMYIGQPICRSSTWYKVPIDNWNEFLIHYDKALKRNVSISLSVLA